ncbi:SDR family NAD(P)-dependent oxidoreductase [Ilumatobacter coccineus]|uniref:Putative oxidoreductase n=1 Tax=Ilumatobacter coccineus (strain NBRC 103263 / KCTC 29153 / YM16-304) TaxID=1313172 RepID=A0A6C7EAL8_ILUCY|nr:SDR family NAD(P)-dependent oxidoreductase [Ilumatobacter coccineus]BAN01678.1 putative oxidoreductase [Ilumatobacter coccineus YM16-304]
MSDERPLPNVSHDLTGQVALVTGATSGLGRRFARVLAAAGAKVIGTGRRKERLDEMVAEITADGGTAIGVVMDMTDTASILSGFDEAEAAFGTITILVNNAGIPDAERAHKMSIELIDNVFDTNLRGPYVLSVEMARRLIEQKLPGRQVNIASISATHYDGHGAALYSITKAGIIRMTEVLAVEWSRNHINVTGIAPGGFHSEMMDGMLERMGDFSGAMPRKRLGRPDQLDSTLLYLCSPASDAVTGTVIKVDDGQSPR